MPVKIWLPGKNKHITMTHPDPRPITYHTKLFREKKLGKVTPQSEQG